MTIFERVIPFPERLRWLMLKTAFQEDMTGDRIAARLGWSIQHVYQVVWGDPRRLRLDCIAEWFFACGGRMPVLTIEPFEEFGR